MNASSTRTGRRSRTGGGTLVCENPHSKAQLGVFVRGGMYTDPYSRHVSEESFDAGYLRGAAVAFGLMGMAEAIRTRTAREPFDWKEAWYQQRQATGRVGYRAFLAEKGAHGAMMEQAYVHLSLIHISEPTRLLSISY